MERRKIVYFIFMLATFVVPFIDALTKVEQAEKLVNTVKKLNETGNDGKNNTNHPRIQKFNEEAYLRPTKCQVCRVMMEEIQTEVQKTSSIKSSDMWLTNRLDGEDKKDEKRGKKINYNKSEIRLMDILEYVCKNAYQYRAIAGPEFPYLRGVKSMFRNHLEDMMAKNGLTLKLDAPEEIVEDPTFEIKRLYFHCNQLLEKHEDDVTDWYMNAQDEDPLQYVCQNKVLGKNDTECLTASTIVPDYALQPQKRGEGEELHQFTSGPKMEL